MQPTSAEIAYLMMGMETTMHPTTLEARHQALEQYWPAAGSTAKRPSRTTGISSGWWRSLWQGPERDLAIGQRPYSSR